MRRQIPAYCDGHLLKALAKAGKDWLEVHYQAVNQLNVFPVPDGDTGTNMLLTIRSAYQEIAQNDSPHAGQIAKAFAYGAMMGSRGNSGTILSQIAAGFAQGIADHAKFNVPQAASALQVARQKAYSGVQKPVEGTILTIIREIADEAEKIQQDHDFEAFLASLVAYGWEAVQRTPDLLPILKQANVVDSGGTGLMYFLEGMLKAARGEPIEVTPSLEIEFANALQALDAAEEADLLALGDAVYNYDVQFVLRGQALPVEALKTAIEAMGDSGVIVGTDDVVKVHIHVDDPGVPLSYAARFGRLHDVVVEDMQAQYQELLAKQQVKQTEVVVTPKPALEGQLGVVAVVSGDGFARVFADLGVNAIINGGQTNNPSTEELLRAVRESGAQEVILLPNNKNILLAAQQAAQHAQGITLRVLPTTTVPQGIAAMVEYSPAGELESVAENMAEAGQEIRTLEITKAVRSVTLDGVAVQEGQWIGLVDTKLQLADNELSALITRLLDEQDQDDYELVTLYYGQEISEKMAQTLAQTLRHRYDTWEFKLIGGGQPHYPYILSLE